MTRVRLLLLSLFALLALPASATAADVTFGFGGLTPGAVVDEQLAGQGLEFGLPAEDYGFTGLPTCGKPTIAWPFSTGDPVAMAPECTLTETTKAHQVFGRLTTLRSRLSMKVGLQGPPPPCSFGSGTDCGYQARLTIFNVRREQIGQTAGPLATLLGTTLSVTRPANDIAYFRVSFDVAGAGLDDVTVDALTVAPTPFFTLVAPANGRVAQDGTVREPVRVVRFNGSTGPIGLSVTGAADLLDAAFPTPNPVTGRTATLTLTGGSYATPGSRTVQLVGTPLAPSAGATPVQEPFELTIERAITLTGAFRTELAPCETAAIGPQVTFGRGYDTPATISLSSLDPATADPQLTPATVTVAPGETTPPMRVRNGIADSGPSIPGADGARWGFTFAVRSGGRTDYFGTAVYRIPVQVTQLFDGVTDSGRLGRPQAKTVIRGRGFCPGASVVFGNAAAVSLAESVTNDALVAPIPRLGTTGRVTVVNPAATNAGLMRDSAGVLQSPGNNYQAMLPTSGEELRIDDYRDHVSLPFLNTSEIAGARRVRFSDFDHAFGDEAYVDACEGITAGVIGCGVATPIPSPIALALLLAEGKLNGLCYGMAVTAGELALNPDQLRRYPGGAGADRARQLVGTTGPSDQLRDKVVMEHIRQWSVELLNGRLNGTWEAQSPASVRERMAPSLARGAPVLIDLQANGKGHTVLGYDVESTPDGGVRIWIADPNAPYADGERTADGVARATALQPISITPDGAWTYPAKPWTGGLRGGTLKVIPLDALPSRPSLLSSLADVVRVVTSGSGARTQAGESATGSIVPTKVPATDEVTVPEGGSVVWAGRQRLASVLAGGSGSGAKATFAQVGGGERLELSGSLDDATLILGRDGAKAERVATVTVGQVRGSDALRTTAAGAVELKHVGAPTSVKIQLGGASRSAPVVGAEASVQLRGGEVLALPARVWSGKGPITAQISGPKGRRTVRLKAPARRGAAPKPVVSSLTVTKRVAAASVAVPTPQGADTVALTWELRGPKGARVIRGAARVQDGAATWTTKRLAKGRYRLTVRAAAITTQGGIIARSAVGSAKARLSVR